MKVVKDCEVPYLTEQEDQICLKVKNQIRNYKNII